LKASEHVIPRKSRVYKTLEDIDDDLHINENLMRFVTDGLKFDVEVVKSKCAHALPYDQTALNEYFKNKNVLSDNVIINQNKPKPKESRKWSDNSKKQITSQELVSVSSTQEEAKPKFKPSDVFVTDKPNKLPIIESNATKTDNFFLTENTFDSERNIERSVKVSTELRKTTDWDDFVLSQLSENTARWIVAKQTKCTFIKHYFNIFLMKKIFSTFLLASQKEKLSELLEIKFGKSNSNEEDIQLV
jgi:hypothetical protein